MFSSSEINMIKNIESRKNFEMVLQSFYSKNYKASVLLLYNLLINDLYAKINLMNDNNYINCRAELEEIENILKEGNESKYSIVEEKVFDIYKNKNILNHATIDLLLYFKKVRNKCAHPFFFKENDYSPSNEEVYLFIVKIYNDILIVDAFFKDPYEVIKKEFETFTFPDLEDLLFGLSSMDSDLEKVKKYFEKKYFRYMTDNNFIKLFKSLVDLSITKNNEEVLKLQYQNFLILKSLLMYLVEKGKITLLNSSYDWRKIKEQNVYDDYNKHVDEAKCFSLTHIFEVLKIGRQFIEELKEENEEVYEKIERSLYSKGYLFVDYWNVINNDIQDAISKLSSRLKCTEYYIIIDRMRKMVNRDTVLILLEKMIDRIPTFDGYDAASRCIDLFIKVLDETSPQFSQDELKKCFKIMNENRQIYDKYRSSRNDQLLKIKKMGYTFDVYANLEVKLKEAEVNV